MTIARAASFRPLAITLVAAALVACVPHAAGPRVGAPFPALRVAVLGAAGDLSLPAAGEPVLLNVWATWCAPCRAEMASLEALHRAAPRGLRVIGVSVDDDRFLAEEFVRRQGLTFANGIAGARALADGPLAVASYPTTFVIDAAGRLAWREDGPRDWASAATRARLEAALAIP